VIRRTLVASAVLVACAKGTPTSHPVENRVEAAPPRATPVDPAMVDKTRLRVKTLAFEAFPMWAMSHPDKMCPDAVADLLEYVDDREAVDAWKRPLQMFCGATLPPGVKGLGVRSVGPDGVEATADDITSWQD